MAHNLGTALSGMSKPGIPARKGTPKTSMVIEAMPAKPKTFVDKNLDPALGPGDPTVKKSVGNAKPGGSIKPEINATPKMALPVSKILKA